MLSPFETIMSTLCAVIIGGFIVNLVLNNIAKRNELKKTKSMLDLEFHRIYKILLNNINMCKAIKDKNTKMRDDGMTEGPDEFTIFDIFQNLLIDTIILHSLISTGSILRLSPNEVCNIQIIESELAMYNNGAEWFLDRLKKFNDDELDGTLDKIIEKTNETCNCLDTSLDFEWFDKEKMIIKVTDELKYITSDKNKENGKCF